MLRRKLLAGPPGLPGAGLENLLILGQDVLVGAEHDEGLADVQGLAIADLLRVPQRPDGRLNRLIRSAEPIRDIRMISPIGIRWRIMMGFITVAMP